MTTPTFMSNKALCIVRTPNGFALAPEANAAPEQCLFFADLDALKAYLAANWTG